MCVCAHACVRARTCGREREKERRERPTDRKIDLHVEMKLVSEQQPTFKCFADIFLSAYFNDLQNEAFTLNYQSIQTQMYM